MSDETDVEIKQRLGVDGHLWAVEFCKHYPNVDEGHAIGWFCNAMMATYDHRQKEIDEAYERGVQSTGRYMKGVEDAQRWWAERWLKSQPGIADEDSYTAIRELTAAAARVMEK